MFNWLFSLFHKHEWSEWEAHGSVYSECGEWQVRTCECGAYEVVDDYGTYKGKLK